MPNAFDELGSQTQAQPATQGGNAFAELGDIGYQSSVRSPIAPPRLRGTEPVKGGAVVYDPSKRTWMAGPGTLAGFPGGSPNVPSNRAAMIPGAVAGGAALAGMYGPTVAPLAWKYGAKPAGRLIAKTAKTAVKMAPAVAASELIDYARTHLPGGQYIPQFAEYLPYFMHGGEEPPKGGKSVQPRGAPLPEKPPAEFLRQNRGVFSKVPLGPEPLPSTFPQAESPQLPREMTREERTAFLKENRPVFPGAPYPEPRPAEFPGAPLPEKQSTKFLKQNLGVYPGAPYPEPAKLTYPGAPLPAKSLDLSPKQRAAFLRQNRGIFPGAPYPVTPQPEQVVTREAQAESARRALDKLASPTVQPRPVGAAPARGIFPQSEIGQGARATRPVKILHPKEAVPATSRPIVNDDIADFGATDIRIDPKSNKAIWIDHSPAKGFKGKWIPREWAARVFSGEEYDIQGVRPFRRMSGQTSTDSLRIEFKNAKQAKQALKAIQPVEGAQ